MTWWEVILLVANDFLLMFIGEGFGRKIERIKQASREEAIRLQAYKDGKTWMFHEMMNTPLPMTNEDYRRMYMGTWAPGIKNDTKESS